VIVDLAWANPFTLLFNDDTAAAGRAAFSAFFDGTHTAFGLRADAKAGPPITTPIPGDAGRSSTILHRFVVASWTM